MQSAGTRRGGGLLIAVVVTLATLAGLGGAPGAVAAQTPSYAPDSPAGTEYAIPLDEARRTGSTSGPTGGQRGSSKAQKGAAASGDDQSGLFGEGVAPAKHRSSSAAGTSRAPSSTTTKGTRAAAATPSSSAAGHLRPASSGISGTAVALGTAGLVLALAAALTVAITMTRRVPRSR